MLRNRRTKCATVNLLAVVVLACHLRHLTEASSLTKSEKPAVGDGWKEATETVSPIREGVIVFGKGHDARANASVADVAAYQADSSGWPRGRVLDVSSKEALWKRMSPSLLCGWDQMKFRAVGPGVKLFSLDQDPPLPLAQVPSTCGYNMHRNPFGLVMHVPYDGCNILQEDENYALPLRWNGVPVILKCPKPTPPVPQDPADAPQFDPWMFPPPFGFPWPPFMPKPHDPAPTTAAPHDPITVMPPHPYPPHRYPWHQHNPPTTAAPPQDPMPQGPYSPWWYYWQKLHQKENPSATTAPPQDPMPQGLYPPWMYYWQQQQLNPPPTAPPQDPMPQGLYPPWLYYWHYLQYKPKELATTAAPNVHHFPPYMYPWFQYLSGATPPRPAHAPWYAQGTNMPWFLPGADQHKNPLPHKQQYFNFPNPWHPVPTTSPTTRWVPPR